MLFIKHKQASECLWTQLCCVEPKCDAFGNRTATLWCQSLGKNRVILIWMLKPWIQATLQAELVATQRRCIVKKRVAFQIKLTLLLQTNWQHSVALLRNALDFKPASQSTAVDWLDTQRRCVDLNAAHSIASHPTVIEWNETHRRSVVCLQMLRISTQQVKTLCSCKVTCNTALLCCLQISCFQPQSLRCCRVTCSTATLCCF
jgi:hypothetical protein